MNKFIGKIPPSIGNLQNLNWLDLADNRLTGAIPTSSAGAPGLDLLFRTKHLYVILHDPVFSYFNCIYSALC